MSEHYPHLSITSREQWRAWLAEHHQTAPGVWVVTYKKTSGGPHVSYDDIVDEAIAHGWVDSRPASLDAERSQILITPRKPTSKWSRVNKQRVALLTAAGQVTPAGQAAVDRAKHNGTWTALDAIEDLHEPDDLRAALDRDRDARQFWDGFPRSTRRAILEWIANAKTPATRERRITETATLAAKDIRANQWRQPKIRQTAEPSP